MHEAATPGHGIRQGTKLLVALALLGYPILIYLLHQRLNPAQLLAGLLALLGLRSLVAAWIVRRWVLRQVALGVLLLIAAGVVLLAFRGVRMHWLRFYPMLFDVAVAAIFFGSLMSETPLVERFARAMRHDLPPEGVVYTRQVTWAWGGLMTLIGLVSLGTALDGSLRWWSLFNGVLVYVVIALAFALEYTVRCHLKRKWSRHERLA